MVDDVELGTRRPGVRSLAQRKLEPATCTVQNLQTFLQVSIGEVEDPAQGRSKLDAEAASSTYVDCATRYDGAHS